MTFFLKPYARNVLDNSKRIFNYRFSRAREVIEDAFIMASRIRIFHRPINSSPENVKIIVKAAVALHNFLLDDNGYLSRGLVDSDSRPGDWREQTEGYRGLVNMPLKASNNYTKDAFVITSRISLTQNLVLCPGSQIIYIELLILLIRIMLLDHSIFNKIFSITICFAYFTYIVCSIS